MGKMGNREPRGFSREQAEPSEFEEAVIFINRVAKVVKGGRQFNFTALVAVGDRKDRVGLGYGKAAEVVDAIKKAVDDGKRQMITISKKDSTIPYEVESHFNATTIKLRPARKGHGIIAGGPARAILHLAGLEDISAKFFGSNTPINCAKATFQALKEMSSPEYIRRIRSGEKVGPGGQFVNETRRAAAEQAMDSFAAETEDAEGTSNGNLVGGAGE
jgi:small subunit ribosomal protein S5